MSYFFNVLCLFLSIICKKLTAESFDDSIAFRINWGSPQERILADPNYIKLPMTSVDNEKFECLIPNASGPSAEGDNGYKGPNALELLWPLIKAQSCTMKSDSYWTYEMCHASRIRQFHEDRDGKATKQQQYVLGRSSIEQMEKLKSELIEQLAKDPNVNPPHTNVGGLRMPYFAIEYNDGTECDVTGRPRRTRVQYVCFDDHRNVLYRVKEIYSCEYEVTVLTAHLCEHPAYRPQELSQVNLYCFGEDPNVKRPVKLRDLEVESQLLMTQGNIIGKVDEDTVRVKIIDANDDEMNILIDSKSWGSRRTAFPEKAPVNTQLVEAFLNGEHCLQGGSGWWHYELCHGRTVNQFHENPDGTKIIIHLGSFDIANHHEWIEANPNKQPKAGTEQVSHFYSNGDICDETNRPRQVEVRLKCKEGVSESSVTLYLLEPKTCEYVLGIESPLLCGLIETADEFGLFREAGPSDLPLEPEEPVETPKQQSSTEPVQEAVPEPASENEFTRQPVQETLQKPIHEQKSTKEPISEHVQDTIEKSKKNKRDPGEL